MLADILPRNIHYANNFIYKVSWKAAIQIRDHLKDVRYALYLKLQPLTFCLSKNKFEAAKATVVFEMVEGAKINRGE